MAKKALYAVAVALLSVTASASAGGNVQRRQAIVAPPTYPLQPWSAQTNNLVPAQGTIQLNGSPVSGVRVRVDNYDLSRPTDANGHFAISDLPEGARTLTTGGAT